MTFNLDTALLIALLGVAGRAVWIIAEIKTTITNVLGRLDNHELRITQLEQK